MRALILRRVALIESGTGGPVLVGAASSGDVVRLSNFLARNGIPYLLLDPEKDDDAKAFIERYAPEPDDLPLAVCPDGSCCAIRRRVCSRNALACSIPHRRPITSMTSRWWAQARWIGNGGLRCFRRSLGRRHRRPLVRRTGRREHAYRELPRFPTGIPARRLRGALTRKPRNSGRRC
jgi:hypothetical protein